MVSVGNSFLETGSNMCGATAPSMEQCTRHIPDKYAGSTVWLVLLRLHQKGIDCISTQRIHTFNTTDLNTTHKSPSCPEIPLSQD